jgi:hypothetical protein
MHSPIDEPFNKILSSSDCWSPGLLQILSGSVLGSVIGLAIVHCFDPMFKMTELPELGINPSPELVQRLKAATYAYWSFNCASAFAVIGLSIGVAIGVTSTAKRRVTSAAAGGTGGALGGLVSGYAVGLFVAQSALTSADQSLVQSAGAHFAVWAATLSLAIVAIGVVQDGPRRAASFLLAGIVTSIGISAAYNLAASIMFMNSNLLHVFPASLTERLVWTAICSVVGGLLLHFSLRGQLLKAT